MFTLIKNSKIYQGLVALALFLLAAFSLIKKGERVNQAKVDKEIAKRNEATRERVRKSDEKISSSNTYTTDWLRKNNRFRD